MKSKLVEDTSCKPETYGTVLLSVYVCVEQLKSTYTLSMKVTVNSCSASTTNYLTTDGQICFNRWLLADAVEPRGCISQP